MQPLYWLCALPMVMMFLWTVTNLKTRDAIIREFRIQIRGENPNSFR